MYAKDVCANNFCLQTEKLILAKYHHLNYANHILGGLDSQFKGEVKLHGLFWCRWKGRFHFPIMALYIKTVLVSHTIPLKTKEMSREFAFFFFYNFM